MLHHVGLETERDRVAACIAFWELLGFVRVEPPASLADRAAWVERRASQVHLLFEDEPAIPAQGHVAVVVDDVEEVVGRLREAGHPVEPRAAHWGEARALARCPQGHRVELMAGPPAPAA